MFYLVGVGLKPGHLTLEALETLKSCDQIYLESYTSEYAEGLLNELQNVVGKSFKKFGRKQVEEEMGSAIHSAKKNNIALMIFGNPLTATTHIQLLLDAKKAGIKTKVIPGISITNMIAFSGLDEYKFGRTVTICYHEEGFEPESFYDQILENQSIGLHTICLLDIKKDTDGRMMNCKEAIETLEKIFKKRKEKINWNYVGLIAMGSEGEKIIFGKENISKSKEITELFPQSLIVIGKTNEKEEEALKAIGG